MKSIWAPRVLSSQGTCTGVVRHAQQGSGCMKNADRTLQLVNGGFQLYFGVEKASHV